MVSKIVYSKFRYHKSLFRKFLRKFLAFWHVTSQRSKVEEWRPLTEFTGYLVSDHGRVLNDKTGRVLSLSVNQRTIVIVGMMQRGVQVKRAVSHLVANSFLHPPPNESFDSIINLNGDRFDNFAANLAWRPRWFAFKYHRQFAHRIGVGIPVLDCESGERYKTIWEAAMDNGLLVHDIAEAVRNKSRVWPTRQRFERTEF